MINYDALIKRAKKAIEYAKNKITPASVHKVTIDDNIEELQGLVVIMHPDYVRQEKQPQTTSKNGR